jgi:hypothetical protein
MTNGGFSKLRRPLLIFFSAVIILGLLGLGGMGIYRLGQSKGKVSSTPALTPTSVPTETVPPSSTPTIDETELIRQACFLKTGLNATNATISINKNTGQHATGTIKELEAVSGAWWIAAKADSRWVCVHTGQSQATCAEIALYNFPKDMVPECLSEAGKVVRR